MPCSLCRPDYPLAGCNRRHDQSRPIGCRAAPEQLHDTHKGTHARTSQTSSNTL